MKCPMIPPGVENYQLICRCKICYFAGLRLFPKFLQQYMIHHGPKTLNEIFMMHIFAQLMTHISKNCFQKELLFFLDGSS